MNIQARARDEGVIPDLESYIDVRRDTSGISPLLYFRRRFLVDIPVIQGASLAGHLLSTLFTSFGLTTEILIYYFRYALGIDLPDFVVEHPVMKALDQGTNDLVTWSNVSFPLVLVPLSSINH